MANISNKSWLSVFIALIFSTTLLAQSSSENVAVGKVGDQEITYGELIDNYNSGTTQAYNLEDLEEFLPIYLDYRAKLLSAKDNGYYSDPDIRKEYQQYAKQAAYAYWLEKKIKPDTFDEFYDRAKYEFKVFHVLVGLNDNASAKQENEAISKLLEAREKIQNGADMEKINEEYSTKRNGRSMGGLLPWFSVGRTVKPFEDAVADMEVGDVSMPFRTQFGYHIATLIDKRERTKARRVKHIFVRAPRPDSVAEQKINSAYQQLEEGGTWNEVMKASTEDQMSKNNDGLIGWVNYGSNYAESLVDDVMELDPSNEYSEPVKTDYGYHIFKIDSVQTFKSEEQYRETLMKKLEETSYYKKSNSFAVNYIQEQYGDSTYSDVVSEFEQLTAEYDTTKFSEIPLPEDLAGKTIYTFNDSSYTAKDYHEYLVAERPSSTTRNYQPGWFEQYTQYLVDRQIVELTKQEFPEFKGQTRSYLDGLVVYQINDDSLWSSATVDTSKLRSMYENSPGEYTYQKRPYYYLISARADTTLHKAKDFIENGNSPDSLRANMVNVAVNSDSTNTFQNEPYNRLQDMSAGTFSEIFEYNKRKAMFYLEKMLPARRMTFDEAFNRLLSQYQPEREEQWLTSLRDKYSVKPNFENLRAAYQKDTATSSK